MNVALIFPPTTVYGDDPTRPTPTPPLGLLYIAAVLEREGHSVTVIDSIAQGNGAVEVQGNGRRYGLGYKAIVDRIKNAQPDMVGISCMFTAYAGDVHRLSYRIKRELPDVFIATGGAYASAYPRYVLEDKNIDCVVRGEGEATTTEIMSYLAGDLKLDGIKGIAFRKGDIITETERRPPISDIDSLPFPARHLVDMNVYVNASYNGAYALRSPSLTMITSRGCPEDCIYCTVKSIWHRKWRGHSAKRVVDEIELLQRQYGIREVYFMDDSAAVSRRRMREICDEMSRRNLDISWTLPNGVAYWTLDRDLVHAMKRAGCYRLTFGIESGDAEIRAFVRKRHSLQKAIKAIKWAQDEGMWVACTFIVGFPEENKTQIRNTIEFAVKSGTDFAVFYLLCPHPGSDVYQVFRNKGLLDLDQEIHGIAFTANNRIGQMLAFTGVSTDCFTRDELRTIVRKAYIEFFLFRLIDPRTYLRLIKKMRTKEGRAYFLRLMGSALKMMQRVIFARHASTLSIMYERANSTDEAILSPTSR